MIRHLTLAVAVAVFAFSPAQSGGARAQDSAAAPAPQVPADMARRLDLAREMHRIRPINFQVEEAVAQLALRFPEDKREIFVRRMMEVFERDVLTDISVNAMAETFTIAELEKMVDYHGSPEGRAIGEKMPVYQALIEPEMIRRIDKALMEVRTGRPAQ